jgi:hypothetical protein
MAEDVIQKLASKSITRGELQAAVEDDPALIPTIVGGLASPKASVRYGCARVLIDQSAKRPERLYPYWETFTGLLGCRYRPLTWSAIIVLANLSTVDAEKRFEAIFNRYYSLLGDGYLVTAANVVGNSAKIAKAKPHLADRIAERLLGVEELEVGPQMTEECRRVVAEQAVEAFDSFYDLLSPGEREKATAFVKRQRTSSRASLARAAREFLSMRS